MHIKYYYAVRTLNQYHGEMIMKLYNGDKIYFEKCSIICDKDVTMSLFLIFMLYVNIFMMVNQTTQINILLDLIQAINTGLM